MDFLKKSWEKLGRFNGLVLILYTTVVLSTHAVVAFVDYSHSFQHICRAIINCGVLSLLACPVILRKVREFSLPDSISCRDEKEQHRTVWIAAMIAFTYLFLAYLAYYPGGLGNDAINQYRQAVTGQYVDWHPVLNTLLCFTIPLKLTGGWSGAVVFFQIIWLTIAIVYAFRTIVKYAGKTLAWAAFAFILLNPNTANLGVSAFKDTSFAIGALFLTAYSLQIFFTKGEWIRRPANFILFVVILVCTTIFRHNAILFTLPLVFGVMVLIPWRRRIALAVGALALFLLVKIPLYSALDVQAPDQRVSETMGVPLNIIASAVTYNPENVDEEILAFAYQIAPQEVWEEKYTYGCFNYIKYDSRTSMDPINERSHLDILKMAFKCLLSAQKEACAGLFSVMDPIYTLTDDYNGELFISVANNQLGLEAKGVGILADIYSLYTKVAARTFSHVVHYFGTMMLLLLIVVLAKTRWNSWSDWKRVFLVLPVFAYNFGTMLLMTHRGDALRFFQYTFFLVPLYLVLFFADYHERNRMEKPGEMI